MRELETLIDTATKTLPDTVRLLVRGRLMVLAGSSQWFDKNLRNVLKLGVMISGNIQQPQNALTHFAQYNPSENTIRIDTDLFLVVSKVADDIKTLLINTLTRSLRHEFNHAFDSVGLDQRTLDERLNRILYIADVIISQTNCILQRNNVSSEALKQLVPAFSQADVIPPGLAINSIPPDDRIEYLGHLKYLGSMASKETSPLLNDYMIAPIYYKQNIFLNMRTFNLVEVESLFTSTVSERNTLNKRNGAIAKTLLDRFRENFNDTQLTLWRQLRPTERTVVDGLYNLRRNLIKNVPRDEVCYQPFLKCIESHNDNCAGEFVNCWGRSIDLTVKDWQTLSLLEMHSSLQESCEVSLFNVTALENLCYRKSELSVVQRNFKRLLPAPSIASPIIYDGLSSAGYNFIDELSHIYVVNHKIKNAAALSLAIKLLYVAIIGCIRYGFSETSDPSLTLHLLLPLCLIILGQLLEKILFKHASQGMQKFIIYGLTGSMFAAHAYTQGFSEFGKGLTCTIASAVPGRLLAKSISKGLGWNATASNADTIPVLTHHSHENRRKDYFPKRKTA